MAEHAEPRRKAAGQRSGVIARIIAERFHLRADVTVHELIEGANAQMPVAVDVAADSDLREARLEIDAGLSLPVSLTRGIWSVGHEHERRISICSPVRKPAGEAALLEVVVAIEPFNHG